MVLAFPINFSKDRRVGAGKENTRKMMDFSKSKGGGINSAFWICEHLVIKC
jgi:hypothetical protein